MTNLPGATRIDIPTADDYKTAGKRLTRQSLKKIPVGCCCCESKVNKLLLIHLSCISADTISIMVCVECANNLTLAELIGTVSQKIIESKETSLQ